MADIFISYSSKDHEKAIQLTELLGSAGLSVWIDKQGIDAATSWSSEIVDAIDSCKALVILLSSNSIESVNVIKEVSLAAEQKKKILPLDLEPVELPRELRYHLAGIQRTPMTNIDGIIRALGNLGLEATQAPTMKLVNETDGKKSLMILPFEDLSPTGDNGWCADGIVSELINALSHIKSLHLADTQATKEFKDYRGQLTAYAHTMQIRYFVQGDVRKFGDQIKISARLLDIGSGNYLWHESIKGSMSDVFEIQEQVAAKVVEGLKLHLSSDEKKKLTERGTDNTEAYELVLKAQEYCERNTKEGFQLAIQLCNDATHLDKGYAKAYTVKANAITALYRAYNLDITLLSEAELLCKEALRLKPNLNEVYHILSMVYMLQGKPSEAEETAKEFIRKAPENHMSHFSLGFLYINTGQNSKAITAFEESFRLKSDNRATLFNLAIAYDETKEIEKRMQWATIALPLEERHLKLHPDDESTRIRYAILLYFSGSRNAALREAAVLKNVRDALGLYNTAALFAMLGEKQEALIAFRHAIEGGFKNLGLLKSFLVDVDEGISSLVGTPEYEEVRLMVEKIEAEHKQAKTDD